jgi:hypothetical protein
MPEPNRSEELRDELEKLLARSREIRAQADELEVEVSRIKRLLGAEVARPSEAGGDGEQPKR